MVVIQEHKQNNKDIIINTYADATPTGNNQIRGHCLKYYTHTSCTELKYLQKHNVFLTTTILECPIFVQMRAAFPCN